MNLFYRCFDYFGDVINVLFLSPNFRSFGNSAEEIYFGLLHCLDKQKKLLLMKPPNQIFSKKINISNKYLYDLEHDLIVQPHFLISSVLSIIMALMGSIGFFIVKIRKLIAKIFQLPSSFYNNKELSSFSTQHFGKRKLWAYSESRIYTLDDWQKIEDRYVPPRLPDALQIICKERINAFAPSSATKKWVTLHVVDTEENTARGADILNYELTINSLINQGFYVFRIGHNKMKKLPDRDGLTDLSQLDEDKVIDLYLLANACFHLGVQSGPSYLAHLFGKDLLMTNMVEWSTAIPRKKGNLFILKNFYHKGLGRYMSPFDLLDEGFNTQINTNTFNDDNFIVTENNPQQILKLVEEYLDTRSNKISYTPEQIKYDLKKNKWLSEQLENKDLEISYAPRNQISLQRIRSLALSAVRGTIASSFLQYSKNK